MRKATLICCTTLLSLCLWVPKVTAQRKVSCVGADKALENQAIITSATCIHLPKDVIENYFEAELKGDYDAFLIYDQPTDEYPEAVFLIQPAEYGYGIVVAEFYPETTDIEKKTVLIAQGKVIVEENNQKIWKKYESELKAALLTLKRTQPIARTRDSVK